MRGTAMQLRAMVAVLASALLALPGLAHPMPHAMPPAEAAMPHHGDGVPSGPVAPADATCCLSAGFAADLAVPVATPRPRPCGAILRLAPAAPGREGIVPGPDLPPPRRPA